MRAGPVPLAWMIALLAAGEAVLGLRAVALHALPDAESIAAVWRPGASFQYPPALAVLEAGALPIFAYACSRRSAVESAAGLIGAALAGAVIALSDDRLAIGLAIVLLAGLFAARRRAPRLRRATIVTALVSLLGGLAAFVAFHGSLAGRSSPAGVARLLGLLVVLCLLAVLGLGLERGLRMSAPGYLQTVSVIAALALSAVAAVALAPRHSTSSRGHAQHAGRPRGSDLLHGRSHEWLAAVQTWLDRPVLGAGAGAYYVASVRHQTVDRSLFAHDEPLEQTAELGVLGLLLAVALYAASGWLLFRAVSSTAIWLLGPLVFAFLVSNLLDWTWHLAGLTAIWAAASGGLEAEASRGASASGALEPPSG